MSIGIVETKYGKLRGEEAREKRYEGITSVSYTHLFPMYFFF